MKTTKHSVGIYIHLPWCISKCPYCDFNSHRLKTPLQETAYVEALLKDLDQEVNAAGTPLEVSSVFFGGGTPSLFSPAAVGRVLAKMRTRVSIRKGTEITLEANPASADAANFEGYRRAGVNRLSIGVQSFDDEKLKSIERAHDGSEATRAVQAAQSAGFERINIDLMYGLPGQTPEQAIADVNRALELDVRHVSHYQLTLEPNTRFYHTPPVLPSEESIHEMESACRAQLARGGLRRYEISAFAAPGHECHHNLNYWRFGNYLGLGAGAHGKMARRGSQIRLAKTAHPGEFMKSAGTAAAIAVRRVLTDRDLALEFMLNRARLMEVIPEAEFESATNLPFDFIEPELAAAAQAGLVKKTPRGWAVTDTGHRYLNTLLEYFLVDDASEARIYAQSTGSRL